MESYLNKMVSEYEKLRREFDAQSTSKPLSELPRLAEFICSGRDAEFRDQFVVPYHAIQKQVRSDLLHPRLALTE